MDGKKCIIVLQRGWVMVCELLDKKTDTLFLNATKCATIRRWGTTKGLGELAEKGPLKETVLDNEPDQQIPLFSIVKGPILCGKGWDEWFSKRTM